MTPHSGVEIWRNITENFKDIYIFPATKWAKSNVKLLGVVSNFLFDEFNIKRSKNVNEIAKNCQIDFICGVKYDVILLMRVKKPCPARKVSGYSSGLVIIFNENTWYIFTTASMQCGYCWGKVNQASNFMILFLIGPIIEIFCTRIGL